ncbi:MAG: RNA polymerase sigma factor [Bacteroidota bacterium]
MPSKLSQEDQQVVNLIKNPKTGNEGITELFKREVIKNTFYKMVHTYKIPKQDVEDIEQDTFLIVFRNIKLERFRGDSKLNTYVIGIAKNLVFSWLRNQKDYVDVDSLEEFLKDRPQNMPSAAIEEIQSINQYKEAMQFVFGQLTSRCQKILKLKKLGYPYEDIASELGLKGTNTVKSTVYRCMKELTKIIESSPHIVQILKSRS